MRRAPLRSLQIEGAAGVLEAIYRPVEGRPCRGGALVCHPHPLHGGSMHTKVVYHLARAFHAAGFAPLRFNFRGVGLSAGEHDGGPGELEDARAALDALAPMHPGLPLIAAGHSFGCWVALTIGAADPRVSHLIGVGVPLTMHRFGFLEQAGKDLLLIQGDRDEFGAPVEVLALARQAGGTAVVLPGGGHLLESHLEELREAVRGHFEGVGAADCNRGVECA